jgi:hypothetical protein
MTGAPGSGSPGGECCGARESRCERDSESANGEPDEDLAWLSEILDTSTRQPLEFGESSCERIGSLTAGRATRIVVIQTGLDHLGSKCL